MLWAVSIPYIKFVSIVYGLFTDATFKYAIPQSFVTVVTAANKELALSKAMEEAKTTISGVELFQEYANAVVVPQQLLNQSLLEERNPT
jgi:hypothetical protein